MPHMKSYVHRQGRPYCMDMLFLTCWLGIMASITAAFVPSSMVMMIATPMRIHSSSSSPRLGAVADHHHNDDDDDDDAMFKELRQRIEREQQPSSSILLRAGHSQSRRPPSGSSPRTPLDHVYVVSFVPPISSSSSVRQQEPEPEPEPLQPSSGIYAIEDTETGNNVILAFTDSTSCDLFVHQLRQQQFFQPKVRSDFGHSL